jgi:cephalosporin hydroxylase
MMKIDTLKATNFGRYALADGTYIRSNEVEGDAADIVYHKNKTTLQTYFELFHFIAPRTILEIGVKEGGSLVLWAELFPEAEVLGIDNNIMQLSSSCVRRFTNSNISVVSADCMNAARVNAILSRKFPEGIDLIIDDAAHTIDSITANFTNYRDHVTADGAYVIEDWKALHPIHRDVLLEHLEGVSYTLHDNMIIVRENG